MGVINPVNEQVTCERLGPISLACCTFKTDVYQRAIKFLIVANRNRGRLPKGNADWQISSGAPAHELIDP